MGTTESRQPLGHLLRRRLAMADLKSKVRAARHLLVAIAASAGERRNADRMQRRDWGWGAALCVAPTGGYPNHLHLEIHTRSRIHAMPGA